MQTILLTLAAIFFLGGLLLYYVPPGPRRTWLWLGFASAFAAAATLVLAIGGGTPLAIGAGIVHATVQSFGGWTTRHHAERARARLAHANTNANKTPE